MVLNRPSKSGKKGKKGKKKKKKSRTRALRVSSRAWMGKRPGLEEFYHGETDKQKFETTKLFRSYKMSAGTVPNAQQQHKI